MSERVVEVHLKFIANGNVNDRGLDSLTNHVDQEIEKLVRKIERRYQNVSCSNYTE